MLVHEQMTPNPVTVTHGMPVQEALGLMKERKIRRLLVVDDKGRLVGIVSEKDLLYASPSPSTSLSVYEINYLLSKLTVEKVMTKKVISVAEDTPLEEAARIMADNKIGGLPVLRDGKLAGIITETDVFHALLQLFGGRRSGVRLTVSVPGAKGSVAKFTAAIAEAGGDIVGLGLKELTEGKSGGEITVKVQGLSKDRLVAAVKPVSTAVIDIREV